MPGSDPRSVATECLRAWTSGDLAGARATLHHNVVFVGPLGTATGIDEYLAGVGRLSEIVTSAEPQKVLVDGDDVCIIYDLVTTTAGTIPTAGVYQVKAGKVASVRAFFDPRSFPTS